MNKIIVEKRETNEIIEIKGRKDAIVLLYSPIASFYSLVSPKVGQILEKYKNRPLVKHKITNLEKKKLAQNPDYINDIPKYEIKGYDKEVSKSRLDRELATEFYNLFQSGNEIIVKFINKFHPEYKAYIQEV